MEVVVGVGISNLMSGRGGIYNTDFRNIVREGLQTNNTHTGEAASSRDSA